MKKILVLSLILTSATSLFAQNINFRIEKDILFAGGTPLTRAFNEDVVKVSNPNGWTGISVYAAQVVPGSLSGSTFATDDPATFLSQVQSLATSELFPGGWTLVPYAGGPIANNNDWNLPNSGIVAVGNSPVLLITTSPIESLTTSDYVGLVSSTLINPSLGTNTVAFNTANSWNIAVLGEFGSFNLAPIPEPSTYAAIFGLLALGGVMIRRRIRK